MFDLFNQLSSMLSGPLHELAYGFKHFPIIFAFFLGLVGAVAPCQLTSNVSAITIYGNKLLVDKVPLRHVFLFILGKIVVFTILGNIIWAVGQEVHRSLVQLFPILRKAIGPLLIVIGLFMIGLFRLNKSLGVIKIPNKLRDSYIGSFLLGVSFTLAFCPTMFVLFILTLMPVVLTTSYGVILPSVFGIGTSFPLLLVIFLMWYLGVSGAVLKKSRRVGAVVQKVAGVLLLFIGIFDTLIYW
ncbi:sulfite exporter TauE/SafE family protein [Ornithinibacillus sp. L9]|uniref:Sulfite exporter TauE/SafE family protein n=1 Tax=Ornithinibacillus caprae TaxID=2678566 RepID=A0A6N8FLH0_9BACI|nr:sulfite exporter TauE/SafE family protein [Ornithinibacillus caprae]MUK89214.1 sulfite exporter TauE/SafE family protein [Ornithinibacillus caprae]